MEEEHYLEQQVGIRKYIASQFRNVCVSEVVQEAYAQLFAYRAAHPGVVRNPAGFVHHAASRLALKRRYWRVPQSPPQDIRGPPIEWRQPWEEVASRELQAVLSAELGALETKQAEAIRGYYFEGRSCAEIATENGTSRDAIKTRLMRARRALRQALERRGVDELSLG